MTLPKDIEPGPAVLPQINPEVSVDAKTLGPILPAVDWKKPIKIDKPKEYRYVRERGIGPLAERMLYVFFDPDGTDIGSIPQRSNADIVNMLYREDLPKITDPKVFERLANARRIYARVVRAKLQALLLDYSEESPPAIREFYSWGLMQFPGATPQDFAKALNKEATTNNSAPNPTTVERRIRTVTTIAEYSGIVGKEATELYKQAGGKGVSNRKELHDYSVELSRIAIILSDLDPAIAETFSRALRRGVPFGDRDMRTRKNTDKATESFSIARLILDEAKAYIRVQSQRKKGNISDQARQTYNRLVSFANSLSSLSPTTSKILRGLLVDMEFVPPNRTIEEKPPPSSVDTWRRYTIEEAKKMTRSQLVEIGKARGLNPIIENVLYAHFENQAAYLIPTTPSQIVGRLYAEELAKLTEEERKGYLATKIAMITTAKFPLYLAVRHGSGIAVTDFLKWAQEQPALKGKTSEQIAEALRVNLNRKITEINRQLRDIGFEKPPITVFEARKQRPAKRGLGISLPGSRTSPGIFPSPVPSATREPAIAKPAPPPEDPIGDREIFADRMRMTIETLASKEFQGIQDGEKMDVSRFARLVIGDRIKHHYTRRPAAATGFSVVADRVLRHAIRQLRLSQTQSVDATMPELNDLMETIATKGGSFVQDLIARAEKILHGSDNKIDEGVAFVVNRIRKEERQRAISNS